MKYVTVSMSYGIMIVLLSGCNNQAEVGMSMEDLIVEEGSSNPFTFHDFRIGMTRGEVYQVLNGVKLSLPDEPEDSSYHDWGSELSAWGSETTVSSNLDNIRVWSGLPNNPYAAVQAFCMEFDDGKGIVTEDERKNKYTIPHPSMLTSEERRARLRAMYLVFYSEKGVSTSIVEACERRFAKMQATQEEKMGALFFFWLNQSSSPRGQKKIVILCVREGELSGFLGGLIFTDVEHLERMSTE